MDAARSLCPLQTEPAAGDLASQALVTPRAWQAASELLTFCISKRCYTRPISSALESRVALAHYAEQTFSWGTCRTFLAYTHIAISSDMHQPQSFPAVRGSTPGLLRRLSEQRFYRVTHVRRKLQYVLSILGRICLIVRTILGRGTPRIQGCCRMAPILIRCMGSATKMRRTRSWHSDVIWTFAGKE